MNRIRKSVIGICAAVCAVAAPILHAQNHFGVVTYDAVVDSTINGSTSASVSLDSLQKWVKQLSGVLPVTINGSSVTIPHRYAANGSTQFRNAAQHIYNVFHRYGLNPVLENNVAPYSKINVVGTLPGKRAEYVMICGHFDSANQNCPGADDNGSGTAAVMELARVLRSFNFEYTIKFVAFGGEEQGLLGAREYTTAHAGDSMRAVINCDMIMWDNNSNRVMQIHTTPNAGGAYSADLADYITFVDTTYLTGVIPSVVNPGIGASDHSRFWSINRSAVLFIEEYGPDFNAYYHTANDSWANLSAAKHQNFFREAARLATASIMHLARLNAPVPVTLAAFRAEPDGRDVRLSWKTENESNNAGFHVERARIADGVFLPIGFVTGAGSSTTAQTYTFTDPAPIPDVYLYRLRQVDTDGSTSTSHTVCAAVGSGRAMPYLAAYPNPASDLLTITAATPDEQPMTLTLYDALGRTAAAVPPRRLDGGLATERLNVSTLPAGMYLLTLETASGRSVHRISVRH
ncbi:MAG: M20/M25/M40 family metallo-hydrolase [Ignavibacteriae bacterium]|nr:M20/M25/M40 family metallo-hydrolase [Ignavibacteriota bacterium]